MAIISEFEQIVRETKSSVLAAVSRYLSPVLKDYIDDVVQETYLKAYRKLCKCQPDTIGSMNNYLFTIAKNEAFRINQKEKAYIQLCEELKPTNLDTDNYDEDIKKDVTEAINNLPEQYKNVLNYFYQGFSLQEIGDKFNLKIGTVKSKLFRGRNLLIKTIKEGENA
ncbi:RNA polymerase sigma factor [Candidatus Margulisiibacteriota bacterium]